MKHILIIWFIIGIFAGLIFLFETWRYAREKISKNIGLIEHVTITIKHLSWWVVVRIIIYGPVSIWFVIKGIEAAKEATKDLFDD